MKEQGSALRIVAFAVAIAIVLGLASVMFQVTASAESGINVNALDLSAHQVGVLGKYPVIGLPTSQLLADYIATSDPNSTNSIVDYFVPFTVYNGVVYYSDILASISYCRSYFDNLPTCTINLGGQIVFSTIYDSIKAGSDTPTKSTDYRYLEISAVRNVVTAHYTTYPNDFYKCTYAFKSSKGDILSDTNVSSIMYARVLTSPYNATVDTNSSSYIKDIDSFADMDSLTLPKGEFVSCKSAPTGYPEGVLWFEDWIKEGMQYPYFSWYIRDNGNHHSYSVKFSYNSSQVDTCEKVFNNRFYEELENVKQNPLLLFAESGVIFAASKLKWLAEQVGLLKNITAIQWKNLSYTDSFVLKSVDMDFSACENSGNKVFSVCLSDYSDIGRYFIYRADIIDNVTGQVLDTTFFCPLNKFNKGNSGYGSKIYDYGDNGDGMLDDLINNSPSVDPSIKNPFDISGDVIDNNYGGGSLSDLDISDIASSLESSVNSVSVFFRFCWTLFPSAIWSIILLGLSLIIILRVLGR